MRYALIIAGVIVVLVVVVVVVGYALPVKHRATIVGTYRAAPETIYAVITDFAAAPSWRADVKRVELLPTGFKETTRNGTLTYAVEERVPNQHLVTRIAEDGEVYNPVFRFVSRFVIGLDTSLRKYHAALGKRLGEQPTLAAE